MTRTSQWFNRAQLYKEVWAEAVTRVAKRYNISDVGLRKICQSLMVPLPPLGYWAKVQAGQKLSIPPLPPYDGPTDIHSDRILRGDEPAEPEIPEVVQQAQFESDPANGIIVAAELVNPHRLIVATEKALVLAIKQAKEEERVGWLHYRPVGKRIRLDRDTRGIPHLPRADALDITVTDSTRPRALRIMNALLHALDSRKLHARIDREGKQGTYVTVAGEDISIRISERTTREEILPSPDEIKAARREGRLESLRERYRFRPTNELSLQEVGGYGPTVTDTKSLRIEERLNEFIVSLFRKAHDRKRARAAREKERLAYEEAARKRYEIQQRQAQELERLKALEAEVQQWRRAQEIRAYVTTAESLAVSEGKLDPAGKFGKWVVWARQRADWLDPLVRAACPEMDGEVGESPEEATEPAGPG